DQAGSLLFSLADQFAKQRFGCLLVSTKRHTVDTSFNDVLAVPLLCTLPYTLRSRDPFANSPTISIDVTDDIGLEERHRWSFLRTCLKNFVRYDLDLI